MSETASPSGLPARTPWSAAVLTVVAVLFPAMVYLGPLGFGPLMALAGICLLPLWSRRPLRGLPLLAFGALGVWALATYAWSPAAPAPGAEIGYDEVEDLVGLKLLFQLPTYAAVVLAAASLSGRAAKRFVLVWAVWLGGTAAVLSFDAAAGAPLTHWLIGAFDEPVTPDIAAREIGQGTAVIAVLLWPCALVLNSTRARFLIVALFVGAVLAAFILQQQSAVIAVALGGLALWLVQRFGPRAARAMGAAAILVLLAAPWLVLAAARAGLTGALSSALPASWDARLDIWSFAAARVLERPVLGWGLDASRTFSAIPLHPHSMALQLWLELGALGAVLGAAVWWMIFDRVARLAERDRAAGAAAAGAATAYFLVGNLSFGVWQEWWLAVGAASMAVCAALATARRHARMANPPSVLRSDGLQPL